MSFRQIIIARAAHVSVEHKSVKVTQDEHVNLIPLDDIAIILIESKDVTFSTTFFASCAKRYIPVLICGDNHIPSALSVSINNHYRPFHLLQLQVAQSEKGKEQLAESLLKAKIRNQKFVLYYINASEHAIELMETYEEEIKGHDEINREGTAAKVFFNQLYGNDFVRFEDDPINVQQNYAYAVFAATLSRYFSMYGFNLSWGINHKGQTNLLNLVYDFIEPFRPIADYYIFENLEYMTDKLNVNTKKELVNLLNARVQVEGKKVTVQYAMELLVKSYLNILEEEKFDLVLPELIEMDFDLINEPV